MLVAMGAVLLAVSVAVGILWADAEGAGTSGVAAWLVSGAVVLASYAFLYRGLRRRSARGSALEWGASRAYAVRIAACLLAAAAGRGGLEAALAAAARDAGRAEASSAAIRIVEGHVASRRVTPWGLEVELVAVRTVDGGGDGPARLLLGSTIGRARREGGAVASAPDDARVAEASPDSRAERLLWPGERVRVGVRWAPIRGRRNPGGADAGLRAARRGFGARARLATPDWVLAVAPAAGAEGGLATSLVNRLRAVREGIRAGLAARWDDPSGGERADRSGSERVGRDAAALARALVLGDRSGLSSEVRDAFRRVGLAHLLAVSGLHVGFVALLAGALGHLAIRMAGRLGMPIGGWPFAGPLGLAVAGAVAYAWLSGAGVPALRASSLLGLAVAARLGRRWVGPAPALGAVAGAMLVLDPALLFDVGALLSFGACLALVLSGDWGRGPEPELYGVERGGATSVDGVPRDTGGRGLFVGSVLHGAHRGLRASLAVSFGTLPILARVGLPVVALAPLLNGLAIPWTGWLVLPSAAIAVLGSGWLSARSVEVLLWPAAMLVESVLRLADRLPLEPLLHPLGPIWIAGMALLGLHCLRRGRLSVALAVWLAVGVLGAEPGPVAPPIWRAPGSVFLDVGQGDATLVRARGSALLVDAGPGPADGRGGAGVARALRALGVHRLDALVVTHGDLDHRGGAPGVLDALPVDELWLPAAGRDDPALLALVEAAGARGTPTRWLHAGMALHLRGELRVDVLWPAAERAPGAGRNDASLVLRTTLAGRSTLLTADVGERVERALLAGGLAESGRLDVLKLGHHGSRGSSSAAFLEALRPGLLVLSAPCDAARGLPNAGLLRRLGTAGFRLAWTGRDGAVRVASGPGGGLVWQGWGGARRCEGDPEARAKDATAARREAGLRGSSGGRVRLTPEEARRAALGEGALGLTGIFRPTQRTAELLLPTIRLGQRQALDLAHPTQRRLHGQGRTAGDRVGEREGALPELGGGDEGVQQADRQGALGIDRAGRIEELGCMHRRDLARQQHGGVARRVEAEGNLFEREGRFGHRQADLARQHQVEAAGAGMSVHRSHEGDPQRSARQRGPPDRSEPLEVLRVDPLAAGQRLGRGDRAAQVHARAEDAIPGAGQDRHTELFVRVDGVPVSGEIAQRFGVEGVGLLGSVDRDHGDMGMRGGALESSSHGRAPGPGRDRVARIFVPDPDGCRDPGRTGPETGAGPDG
ncbi:MAG: ComEC/Rec2 family competence protein [Myxococcota bacterium]